MTVDDKLVDEIVRDVLEVLRRAAAHNTSTGPQNSTRQMSVGQSQESNGLVVSDSVITADLLNQRVNGQRRIGIGTRSILTPSARDFLNSQGIEWDRQSESNSKTVSGSRWLAVVVRHLPVITTALDEVQRTGGIRWQREIVGENTEAVSLAVSALCRAEVVGAVLFAESPEAVACVANRSRDLRAVAISDVTALRRVQEQMGANLICVNPTGKSHFEIRNMLRELTTGEPPRIPDHWAEQNQRNVNN